jgi:hypothetical protein
MAASRVNKGYGQGRKKTEKKFSGSNHRLKVTKAGTSSVGALPEKSDFSAVFYLNKKRSAA